MLIQCSWLFEQLFGDACITPARSNAVWLCWWECVWCCLYSLASARMQVCNTRLHTLLSTCGGNRLLELHDTASITVAAYLSVAAMQCGEHPAGSQRSWRAECNGVVIVDDRREENVRAAVETWEMHVDLYVCNQIVWSDRVWWRHKHGGGGQRKHKHSRRPPHSWLSNTARIWHWQTPQTSCLA